MNDIYVINFEVKNMNVSDTDDTKCQFMTKDGKCKLGYDCNHCEKAYDDWVLEQGFVE